MRAGLIPVWTAAGLLAVVGALVVVHRYDPAVYSFYPSCRYYEWTGWRCPGCGSTRAVHQLLHGNPGAAFYYNPLLVVTLPVGVVIGAQLIWRRWRRLPPPAMPWHRAAWAGAVAVGGLIAFWIARNLPGWPWL